MALYFLTILIHAIHLPQKADGLSPHLPTPTSPQLLYTLPLASGQATSNVAKHPAGLCNRLPEKGGAIEVEPGVGCGSPGSCLPYRLACCSDRSGPRGRGQGCPFISPLQGCTRHPLASSLNRRKGEAATGGQGEGWALSKAAEPGGYHDGWGRW